MLPRAPILPNEHSRTTSSRAPVCSLGIVIGVRVRIARNCNYYHILEITRRANVYFGGSNARARHIINGVDSVHVKTGERSETRVHTRTDFIQSRRGKETTTASRPELFESCLCVISSTYESYWPATSVSTRVVPVVRVLASSRSDETVLALFFAVVRKDEFIDDKTKCINLYTRL